MHRSENKFSASERYLIVQRILVMIPTFLIILIYVKYHYNNYKLYAENELTRNVRLKV